MADKNMPMTKINHQFGGVIMGTIAFESLIKDKAYKAEDRWYPEAVDTYKLSFNIDTTIENSRALESNLAYSMQYLEFLEKEFSELNVSSVIYTMLVKTYVITGMSILEGLFSNIIKSHGWWKMSDLESLGTPQSNETNFAENSLVVRTELLKRVDSYPLQMNLDELIKILSHHHDALQVNHLVYPALKRLKDLRNRGQYRSRLSRIRFFCKKRNGCYFVSDSRISNGYGVAP